jgi:hypothetical protein
VLTYLFAQHAHRVQYLPSLFTKVQDFAIQTICADNNVYTGQLFSIEQCEQLNRMSEHYAYKQIGTIKGGWTDQIYTLTAQHMACKDVPGMITSTRIIMRQLIQELYIMFPGKE